MGEDEGAEKPPETRVWRWFGSICALLLCCSVLTCSVDRTTQLQPLRGDAWLVYAWIAAIAAACGTAIWLWRSITSQDGGKAVLLSAMGAGASAFLLAMNTADILNSRNLFPAGQTHSYQALIPIAEAYVTRGKTSHYYIRTMPDWPPLTIDRSDYAFMLGRGEYDPSRDPNLIYSEGRFCDRVVLQQAGQAIRLVNPHMIHDRTVIICPPGAATAAWRQFNQTE